MLKKIVPTRGKVLLILYTGITLDRAQRMVELISEITYPSKPPQNIVNQSILS
jgi:hypothetical protein